MSSTVILGLGSPHGDDQFGWAVVDQIAEMQIDHLSLRKINHPIDIIEELSNRESVIIVDAAVGLPAGKTLHRLDYANPDDRSLIRENPSRGTHDFGIERVLRLAESLRKRLDHVGLWIASGERFERLGEMTDQVKRSVDECSAAIIAEVCHARMVTR